jgi:hypothetical protein
MSADMYRRQLEQKRQQRMAAQKQANDYRSKETTKRQAASQAQQVATRSSSASTVQSKLREAGAREKEANAAAKEADRYQKKAFDLQKEENALELKLQKGEAQDASTSSRELERQRKQTEQRLRAQAAQLDQTERARRLAEARAAELTAQLGQRMSATESRVEDALRHLPPPRMERLRILLLGASSGGDLRVGREQKRIRQAVQVSQHRDLVELDVRPAATTADLLDGITGFRPHIVHFSGHSNETLIEFEDEIDEPHEGVIVTARAFASAVAATDQPPLLILLNSCSSAAQAAALVASVAPFAIGMADSIDDGDAITYAAQFYAAVGNGQSILSSHLSARAALELGGLAGEDLPTLAWADDVDPGSTMLVVPPSTE